MFVVYEIYKVKVGPFLVPKIPYYSRNIWPKIYYVQINIDKFL